ncbi:alpha/beta hydrolase family esterase [Gordonia aquimaris]|uniref:Polyhydroxybutyrate depolymerase n=1 Tax=Gordonia aquimaris TaxID=2984863 RepID=A0A9X3I3L9_9ACTN|nr:polyhydroxybutyrate depolymerase [Gordonia aquimaris]MCX2963792.1 polyhydroxybutyrate depolymerase [Gordonia aquimaris]
MSGSRRRIRRRLSVVWFGLILASGLSASLAPAVTATPLPPFDAPAPHGHHAAVHPVSGCAGNSVRPGSSMVRSVSVGGVTRRFRVHVPAFYPGTVPVPLILAYHGRAERAAAFERYTGLSGLPAVVVYPVAAPGRGGASAWQGAPYSSPRADDVGFTRAMLRDLRSRFCVDRGRTYAIGRSNGGGLVAMLACRLPADFAGFATVGAAVYQQAVAGCAHGPAISLIDFHGTADRTIAYRGGTKLGASYLSTSSWLRRWTQRAGCVDAPLVVPMNRAVDRISWPLCARPEAAVVHYRLGGGTHRWPAPIPGHSTGSVGDTVSATELIWQFFLTHPRLGSS